MYLLSFLQLSEITLVTGCILQADKFLKCDWLRPVVFEPNLKYLHVKVTPVTECEISLLCSINRKQHGFFGVFGLAVFIPNTPRNRAISYTTIVIFLLKTMNHSSGIKKHFHEGIIYVLSFVNIPIFLHSDLKNFFIVFRFNLIEGSSIF